ncbi:MAG: hypothetical protein EOO15_19195 [Chitinophagaceae bacterium]|nr:MAG: hypothetical protein EOO15_19195 [Chitinophagaceae bacterium]
MLVLLLGLFVIAFRACFRSSRGSDSMDALLRHMLLLTERLGRSRQADPSMERPVLERLLNRAKVANTSAAISANEELKQAFTRSYNLVSETAELPAHRMHPHWTQMKMLMFDFHRNYFSQTTGKNTSVEERDRLLA